MKTKNGKTMISKKRTGAKKMKSNFDEEEEWDEEDTEEEWKEDDDEEY